MQTASADLQSWAVANIRRPCLKVSFQWNGTDWTDEAARVMSWERTIESARIESGIAVFGDSVSGKATILLDNSSNRYSQYNTGGALYSYIGGGKFQRMPVKIEAGFTDPVLGATSEYLTQFVGHVVSVTEDAMQKTILLYCEDQSLELRYRRMATEVYAAKTAGEWMKIVLDALNTELLSEGRTEITYSLDDGRYAYDYVWMEDDYIWEELKRVAEADGGRMYFNGAGTLRYEDPTHLLLDTTSRHTFTVAKFAGLTHQWQWQQPPVNHVIVRYRPRYIAGYEVVYRAGETLVIKPGETLNHKAEFSDAVWSAITPVADIDYVAITAARMNATSDLTVGSITANARDAIIPLTNGNAYETLYVTRLQLRGYPIGFREPDNIEKTDDTSIAQYGKVTKTVNNPYIQSYRHADAAGQFMLDREKNPKHVISISGIPAIPWLEVSDRITVTESDSGTNVAAFIIRETQGMSFMNPQDAKYHQSIDALPVTDLYPYTDYFQIGVTPLGVPQQLILNTGFEFSGTGGNTFLYWTDVVDAGAIADEGTIVQQGDHAAKLTAGGASDNTQINQTMDVRAGLEYQLLFYTRGDETVAGQYQIYDVTNSANIVATKTTGVSGATYTQVSETFDAPANCKQIRLILRVPPAVGTAYYDNVSLKRTDAGGRLFY